MNSEYELGVTTQYSHNEGKAEGRAETARAMLADGVDPVRITKYTGLSAEELEALKVLK